MSQIDFEPKPLWKAVSAELKSHRGDLDGESFHSSNIITDSATSLHCSQKSFPNATVISLEKDIKKAQYHVKLLDAMGVLNNALCEKTTEDDVIFKNVYESPELFSIPACESRAARRVSNHRLRHQNGDSPLV